MIYTTYEELIADVLWYLLQTIYDVLFTMYCILHTISTMCTVCVTCTMCTTYYTYTHMYTSCDMYDTQCI